MKNLKSLNLKSKKIRFIKNAIYVWSLGQIILHIFLLFLSIPISVFLSNIFSVPIRYYFYGKNVFGIDKSNFKTILKFIFTSILLWILNTLSISFIFNFGFTKNISALITIPFVATISYLIQKNFVFKE